MLTRLSLFAAALALSQAADAGNAPLDCADESPTAIVDLPADQRIEGLATLWMEARYSFPNFDLVPELNWNDAFRRAIPRVLEAESCYSYYLELQRFVAQLHDGHTRVYIPRPAPNRFADVPAAALGLIDDTVYIKFVSEELEQRIPLGSVVHAIDGEAAMDRVERLVLPLISASTRAERRASAVTGYSDWGISPLAGPPGSMTEIEFTTPSGQRRTQQLERSLHRDLHKQDQAIKVLHEYPDHGLFHFEWLDNGVTYLWLGSFGNDEIIERFENLLPELRDRARALIIDLRGNGGGSTSTGAAILRRLIDRPVEGSTWRSRKYIAVYRAWGEANPEQADAHHLAHAQRDAWETGQHPGLEPVNNPLHVPVALLTGRDTASAAEDFLVYADGLPGFTRIGKPTRGSTGQPLNLKLPGGGLAHLVVKRDRFPDGRDFVGTGIAPDVLVAPALNDLLNERDPALEAAVAHLTEQLERRSQEQNSD